MTPRILSIGGLRRRPAAPVAAFAVAVLVVTAAGTAGGIWGEQALPLCTVDGEQNMIDAVPDGEGGAVVVWRDDRSGSAAIYARRVDAAGTRLWGFGGRLICEAAGSRDRPRIIAVPDSRFVVIWEDSRGGNVDLYGQKLDLEGNELWTPGGVPVAEAAGDKREVDLAVVASDQIVAAWTDTRNGDDDIYIQRLDASGNRLWSPGGLPVMVEAGNQQDPSVAAEADGRAWVLFRLSEQAMLAAQIMDEFGGTAVPAFAVPGGGETIRNYAVASDGAGGLHCVFEIAAGNGDIAAQRLLRGGNFAEPMWDVAVVCGDSTAQHDPTVVAGAEGDALVFWIDERGPAVHAQRIDGTCAGWWQDDGIPVGRLSGLGGEIHAAADGAGGAVVNWPVTGTFASVPMAQRVSAAGDLLWHDSGTAIQTTGGLALPVAVVSDGEGGLITTILVQRLDYDLDVYAQRLDRSGRWGFAAPVITAVADVAADQGGRVLLAWNPSSRDTGPDPEVTRYSIWRSVPAAAAKSRSGAVVPFPVPRSTPGALRTTEKAGEKLYWEWIADRDAHLLEGYAHAAPTLRDSTSAGPADHTFLVSAHADDPAMWWDSEPVAGHSVDNLAPTTPEALRGEASTAPTGLRLSWRASEESDLHSYVLHRGADADFIPGVATLVATTVDTTILDATWSSGESWYYKLAAIDVHENSSGFALLRPEQVTAVDLPPALRTKLLPNRPNPFNPRTRISFTVREAGTVTLDVHDVAGRRVRLLLSGRVAAGPHELVWDGRDDHGRELPSGVYVCRLRADGRKVTDKMTLVR